MPCVTEVCNKCHDFKCPGYSGGKCINDGKKPIPKILSSFDTAGALCNLLSMLESDHPKVFARVDKKTRVWWKAHEESEQDRIKHEALAKLSPREKRALNLK